MTARWLWPVAWLLGALAVIAGAFGAHALKERLPAANLTWWETAVLYHFFHAIMLAEVGRLAREGRRFATGAGMCFLLGILIFSGSLYAMALTDIKVLGAITPIGGVLLIVGWLLGFAAVLPTKEDRAGK